MANQDPLLSFEEFMAQRNNFDLHFAGEPGKNMTSDIYRNNSIPWKHCMKEQTEDFSVLVEWLTLNYKLRSNDGYLETLYDAYKMMHPHAQTNWEMFQ